MQFLTCGISSISTKFYLFVLVSLLVAAVACGPAATAEPNPSPTPGPTTEPSPTPGMLERPAPIESVAIEVSATDSPKADLVVVSGLPNACYTFGHYDISREGDTFRVDIVNLIPDDPMLACAEIYGLVTTRIPLEGGVETCQFYDVVINGETYLTQAIAPNVRCGNVIGEDKKEAQLKFGQKTQFSWTDLELTLADVTEDSRCPSDVVCIWSGRAIAVIKAEMRGEELGQFPLTLGEGPEASKVEVNDYTIELLSLEPYPKSSVETAKEDYVASVAIWVKPKS